MKSREWAKFLTWTLPGPLILRTERLVFSF